MSCNRSKTIAIHSSINISELGEEILRVICGFRILRSTDFHEVTTLRDGHLGIAPEDIFV